MTGTIKVYGLSHKWEKQSDAKLSWEMFRKIYHMYGDTDKKEKINAALLLTSMSYHKGMS